LSGFNGKHASLIPFKKEKMAAKKLEMRISSPLTRAFQGVKAHFVLFLAEIGSRRVFNHNLHLEHSYLLA
jgi:hypothetical protein